MLSNRSKETRKSSGIVDSPTTQRSTAVLGALASDNSQHGFTKLPLELHLKIISHFPVIPDAVILADPWTFQRSIDGPEYLARFHLSGSWGFYLPLCWERVQVMLSGANRKWQNDLGRGLEIQSEGLITKSPHLLPLVKIVTVCLVPSKICKPMPSFVELLANLPNLHTIQIVNRDSDVLTGLLRKLFYGRVLPSVRSVILPSDAYDILRCCPGIREVTCNEWNGAHLVQGLTEGNCNEVEVLRGIFPSDFYVKRLAKLNPPLRLVRLEARGCWWDFLSGICCLLVLWHTQK
ncbi:hypothetical protein BDV93DRAFT_515035 [Ceratobasidium sp. AG-I]|nr:hypothetical protein BDV93DRAFT_515035 [Ceratobasidium sp. AG-I]